MRFLSNNSASSLNIWLRIYWSCYPTGGMGRKLSRQAFTAANRASLHCHPETVVSDPTFQSSKHMLTAVPTELSS